MAKPKRKPTAEEVKNDPSLRWFPYRQWETVYSDSHGDERRFVRYEGDSVVLAEINSMAEIPGSFPVLSVRRLTALYTAEQLRLASGGQGTRWGMR